MLLDRQDEAVLRMIEEQITAGLVRFDAGGTLQIPVPAIDVSGRRGACEVSVNSRTTTRRSEQGANLRATRRRTLRRESRSATGRANHAPA